MEEVVRVSQRATQTNQHRQLLLHGHGFKYGSSESAQCLA